MTKKLLLIPSTIAEDENLITLSPMVREQTAKVSAFLVESAKSARRFLKKLNPEINFETCTMLELSEHSKDEDVIGFLKQHFTADVGIISEAGVPCVADPGSRVVLWAHEQGWEIIPLVGPSSILLALMASGLNGQNFAFNGYLPKEKDKRIVRIRDLERRSYSEQQTQIFMETPYRNQNIFQDLLENCSPQTLLCVASDLTGPKQFIKTMQIEKWKKQGQVFDKVPALFLIQKL